MTESLNQWVERAKVKYAHIPILSIEEMLVLPEPQEFDAGVYFCWLKGGLTYIGKSKHICERLYIQDCMNKNGHNYSGIRAKPVEWDRVTCIVLETGFECSPRLPGLLTQYERAYIAAYQPFYNQDYQDGFT